MSKKTEGEGADNESAPKKIVMMSFNMPYEWHTEFKIAATARGQKMNQFLVDIFDHWKRTKDKPPKGD